MSIVKKEFDEPVGKAEKLGNIVERNTKGVVVHSKNRSEYLDFSIEILNSSLYIVEDGEVFLSEYSKEYICSECDNRAIYDSQEEDFYCPRCNG